MITRVPNSKRHKKHEKSNVIHYLGNSNPTTMFLKDVTESGILSGIAKNQKSTGNDNIDMSIVKKVILHIVKPIIHICHNSFKIVSFQIE